jgi:hypothetical protein
MAVAGSIPGHEIEHPMALVILIMIGASRSFAPQKRSAAASHGQQSPAIQG